MKSAAVAFLAAALVVAFFASGAHAQYDCVITEDWKIPTGIYPINELYINGPSFGIWRDKYEHVEYMWLHHNTSIDFYDLTSSAGRGPDGNPTLAFTIPSGSTCSQARTFAYGDQFITTHGDVPFCTCKWSDENRCPHRVGLSIPGQPDQQLVLGINSVLNVDRISPDVTAMGGLAYDASANPSFSCETIINPQDVAGKYCIVDRGGCLFQTKYENCRAAGAVGTIIVNRNEGVLVLPVFQVDEGDVLVMVGLSDGQILKDNIDTATITIGRGTGPPQPTAGYSEPDAMGSVVPWTGENIVTGAPFFLVDDIVIDYKRQLMYGITVDGNNPSEVMVLDLGDGPDESGMYPALGVFPQGADGTYWDIAYQDPAVYLIETSWVQDIVYIYNATADPASPELLTTFAYDESWCPGSRAATLTGVEVHPSGQYIYVLPGGRDPAGTCPNDDYLVQIYDFSDPANPFMAGTFAVNDMDERTSFVAVNGLKWAWGPDNIAALPMASSGLVFYDFTDPLNPVKIAENYDPTVAVDDFTKGMYDTQYGDNGYWIAYERDGIDGVHGIWHALKLEC